MGRRYAGVLGPLAFGVVIAHSLVGSDSAEATLPAALMALFAFAAIGWGIGYVAERTVVEATEARFHAELQASETTTAPAAKGTKIASDPGRTA